MKDRNKKTVKTHFRISMQKTGTTGTTGTLIEIIRFFWFRSKFLTGTRPAPPEPF